jgi:hypothetical protein
VATRSLNLGYTGYPALFFLESLHQDRGEKKLIERMWSQHARYSYLNAWLYDENDLLRKGVPVGVGEKMNQLRPEVDAMFDAYDSVYEGESCTIQEKEFMKVLRGIRERIDTIGSISGIVDTFAVSEGEYVF